VRWRGSEVARLLEDEAEVGKIARAARRGRADLTVRVVRPTESRTWSGRRAPPRLVASDPPSRHDGAGRLDKL
jgi:hypothetical protein